MNLNDFSILNKQLIREIHFCWLLSPLCRRDERDKTKHAYEPAGNKYYHESHEKRISTMKINSLNVNLMLNFFKDLNLTFKREKCFQNALILRVLHNQGLNKINRSLLRFFI